LLLGMIRQRRSASPPPVAVPRGLLSFRQGLRTLPDALARELGSRCRLNESVMEIAPRGAGWRVTSASGPVDAERVVLCLPASAAASLVAPFEPDAAAQLSSIPAPPLAVLHLSWPLEAFAFAPVGFGYLVVPQPQR